jgi:sugar O-acyltransferase (sialic acid O-acetyltransferase NeuD family)
MHDVIIVGAGGFGREVYLWAKSSLPADQYRIKGFYAKDRKELDGFDIPAKILGDEDSREIGEHDRFLLAIGTIEIKKRIAGKLKQRGAKFLSLVHHTAVVAPNAKLGEGVILCPFTTITDSVVLGDFVMMNLYASCGHDVKVGNHCILCPYATVNGFAVLEDDVFLGSHSTVTAHRRIGRGARICANSVALRDVPAGNFHYGVPGKSEPLFES